MSRDSFTYPAGVSTELVSKFLNNTCWIIFFWAQRKQWHVMDLSAYYPPTHPTPTYLFFFSKNIKCFQLYDFISFPKISTQYGGKYDSPHFTDRVIETYHFWLTWLWWRRLNTETQVYCLPLNCTSMLCAPCPRPCPHHPAPPRCPPPIIAFVFNNAKHPQRPPSDINRTQQVSELGGHRGSVSTEFPVSSLKKICVPVCSILGGGKVCRRDGSLGGFRRGVQSHLGVNVGIWGDEIAHSTSP